MCAAMEMGPRVGSEKAVFQSSSDSEERLKPQALQGSLLTTLLPTWPRWVPGGWGCSWDERREEELGEAKYWEEGLELLICGPGHERLSKLPGQGERPWPPYQASECPAQTGQMCSRGLAL